MTTIEKNRQAESLQEGAFHLTEMSLVALNHSVVQNGEVNEIDFAGIAKSLAARKNTTIEQIVAGAERMEEFFSTIVTVASEKPFQIDDLSAIWDVNFYLTHNKHFDQGGELRGDVDAARIIESIARKRGISMEEAQEMVCGSRDFLNEFIAQNSKFILTNQPDGQ